MFSKVISIKQKIIDKKLEFIFSQTQKSEWYLSIKKNLYMVEFRELKTR